MDNLNQLKSLITQWSIELGFDDIGISDINIQEDEHHLNDWLKNKYHGSMFYMEKHGNKRSRPDLLVNGTLRVISLKVHYYSRQKDQAIKDIKNTNEAYIAKQNVGAQGLSALEQLLYPQASQDSLLIADDKVKRCQAATAISANVATITVAINNGWQPSGGNYYAQFTEGTGDFTSRKDAVEEVVTNWVEQLELVKDEKMLIPLGNASPGLPLEAEHISSDSAFISIQQNVAAFKVIYTAGGGHGFDNILIDYLEQNSLCFIEWPELGKGFIPSPDIEIFIRTEKDGRVLDLNILTDDLINNIQLHWKNNDIVL